jgi:hypothetical protein
MTDSFPKRVSNFGVITGLDPVIPLMDAVPS